MISSIQKQKNTIIILGLVLVVFVSLIFKFNKYVIEKDFFAYVYAPCDIEMQNCFEFEGEQYVKLYQKAYVIEQCRDGSCDMFACNTEPEQNLCLVIQCSEETIEEGESCITEVGV